MTTIDIAASIATWLFTDSRIQVDAEEIATCLAADAATAGRLPTEAEAEVLVTGGDEGEVPDALTRLFPLTSAFISDLF